mgnify:CR=1 FL=1
MSIQFLSEFMRFATSVTRADRGMVIDMNRDVVDKVNMDNASLQNKQFGELLGVALDEAEETGNLVTANNLIHPDDAPETNTHLGQLRLIFVMPFPSMGFVYIDQHVRNGIIKQDLAERIIALGRGCVEENKLELTADELADLFAD